MDGMKVRRFNPVKLVWAGSFVAFLSLFTYVRLLPSLFPAIRPIEPEMLTGVYDTRGVAGVYLGQKVVSSEVPLLPLAQVLGANNSDKRIEVDLTHQRLYAFEGSSKVYDFPISSGKWFPTPTGTFRIWGKFRYTKMEGGNPLWNTYYYLPNVPFVMFFSNDRVASSRGFSLHGTYWHNNFGHPMSHGCVNLRISDAGTLFYWTSPDVGDKTTVRADASNQGTEITIYGMAPKE